MNHVEIVQCMEQGVHQALANHQPELTPEERDKVEECVNMTQEETGLMCQLQEMKETMEAMQAQFKLHQESSNRQDSSNNNYSQNYNQRR
eukprot:14100825-Ditylum_brightwellii.AAC.1